MKTLKTDLTGPNRENRAGRNFSVLSVASCSNLLARDTSPTYVDNRPLLVAGKPELREYKAVFVVGDIEVSQFSDEITVNCAPLV